MKPALAVLVAAGILAQAAGAQSAPAQKAITNRDVVLMAKAGFSQEFIVGTILAGPSHFDTSASALVELAKEGLNEGVVRVIAGVGSAPEPEEAAPVKPAPAGKEAGKEKAAPGKASKITAKVVKPSPIGLAIATGTPFVETSSMMFGLMKKKVEVGTATTGGRTAAPATPHLIAGFPTVVAPAGAATRYVVIP